MLVADTVFGDWYCMTHGTRNGIKQEFGTFTADTGMVCITADAPEKMPEKLQESCYTRIRNFSGRALLIHYKGECHVEGIGKSGNDKIEFFSVQLA